MPGLYGFGMGSGGGGGSQAPQPGTAPSLSEYAASRNVPGGARAISIGGNYGGGGYSPPASVPGGATIGGPQTSNYQTTTYYGGSYAPPMTNTTSGSPQAIQNWQNYQNQLTQAIRKQNTPDPNLQFLLDQFKTRLGTDPTREAIERSTSNIRDTGAGAGIALQQQAERMGVNPARAQTGLAEAEGRRAAGAATDISLGRQSALDRLVLGGQGIASAPGLYGLAAQGQVNNLIGAGTSAAALPADIDLKQQGLALQQTLGLGDLGIRQNQLGIDAARATDNQLATLMNLYGYGMAA